MGDLSKKQAFASLLILGAGAIAIASALFLVRRQAGLTRPGSDAPSPTVTVAGADADATAGQSLEVRAPAAPRVFLGEIRIGDPRDSVRFGGDGRVHLDADLASGLVFADVRSGRFRLEFPGADAPHVSSFASGTLTAQVTSGGELLTGVENIVYASWGPRRVRISVYDELTLAHLGNVAVWRARDATYRDLDPMWGGPVSPGPDASAPVVLTGATSPFLLEVPAGDVGGYWIGAPRHVPYRYGFPNGFPHDSLTVVLRRAGTLEVALGERGFDTAPARVRLGRLLDRHDQESSDAVWLLERAVERTTLFEGLGEDGYRVQLLAPMGRGADQTVLDERSFSLEAGEHRRIVLDSDPGQLGHGRARVTLQFPYLSSDGSRECRALIEPRNPRMRHGGIPLESPIEPGGSWGPLELPAGDYSLVLHPHQVAIRFSALTGQDHNWVVPAFPTMEVDLTLLGEADGQPLSVYGMSWFAPMDFLGAYDPSPWFDPIPEAQRRNPLPIHCPASRLRVRGNAIGMGEFRAEVDPLAPGGGVVVVSPPACLEIRLKDLDDVVTHDWLWKTQVRLEGNPIQPSSIVIDTRDGEARGLMYLERGGHLELDFPPLPSHGSLDRIQVEARPGDHRVLTLDPSRLRVLDSTD